MSLRAIVRRNGYRPVGLLFVSLLFGCTPQASPDPPPSPPAPRLAGTPSAVVVPQAPPPEQDVYGPLNSIDRDPEVMFWRWPEWASGPLRPVDHGPLPPRFDPTAWLSQRGVTDPIPQDTYCEEALPTAPNRPDMLLCTMYTEPYSETAERLEYVYRAKSTVVLAVADKKLRKVFDVLYELQPFDGAYPGPKGKGPILELQLVVRVEDNGAAIVVEDSGEPNCAEAIAGEDYPGSAPRRRFKEKLCKARGRYVFSKGSFVKKR